VYEYAYGLIGHKGATILFFPYRSSDDGWGILQNSKYNKLQQLLLNERMYSWIYIQIHTWKLLFRIWEVTVACLLNTNQKYLFLINSVPAFNLLIRAKRKSIKKKFKIKL